MTAIAVDGLTKVFDNSVAAVAGLDFQVGDGEFVALLGPTGCGKTTALRLIAGLERPTTGSVSLGGRDATRAAAVGLPGGHGLPGRGPLPAPQRAGEHLVSAADGVGVGARRRGAGGRGGGFTGVRGLLAQRPDQLSGGERQRVALARALVREPLALLLDEPLSHVDFVARGELRAAILELTRRLGLGTLYVTHDQAGARSIADRLLVMRRGRVEQAGPPGEVYDDPATLFVAAFLGNPQTSLLQGAVYAEPSVATVIDLGDQAIRLPWGTPLGSGLARHHGARVVVAIRPDAATVTPTSTAGSLTGRVTAVQQIGALGYAWLDIGGIAPALSPSELELIEAEPPRDRRLVPGQRTGDSLRHALARLVPHGAPAPPPTARTTYGFYPVYDGPSAAPEVNLGGTVVVRIPVSHPLPQIGDALGFTVDPARVYLFDKNSARLRP